MNSLVQQHKSCGGKEAGYWLPTYRSNQWAADTAVWLTPLHTHPDPSFPSSDFLAIKDGCVTQKQKFAKETDVAVTMTYFFHLDCWRDSEM